VDIDNSSGHRAWPDSFAATASVWPPALMVHRSLSRERCKRHAKSFKPPATLPPPAHEAEGPPWRPPRIPASYERLHPLRSIDSKGVSRRLGLLHSGHRTFHVSFLFADILVSTLGTPANLWELSAIGPLPLGPAATEQRRKVHQIVSARSMPRPPRCERSGASDVLARSTSRRACRACREAPPGCWDNPRELPRTGPPILSLPRPVVSLVRRRDCQNLISV